MGINSRTQRELRAEGHNFPRFTEASKGNVGRKWPTPAGSRSPGPLPTSVQNSFYFVTRLKRNADIQIVEEYQVPKGGNVLKDQKVRLQAFVAGRPDLQDFRLVTLWLEDKQEELVLLTNHFKLAASTIAAIYKERWQIELFFKLLKQQLQIKTFVGTSANAVRIQIWTALIAVLIVRYLQFRSHFKWALSNLVALLRWNLFTYRNLWDWLNRPFDTPPQPSLQLQLNLDSIRAAG